MGDATEGERLNTQANVVHLVADETSLEGSAFRKITRRLLAPINVSAHGWGVIYGTVITAATVVAASYDFHNVLLIAAMVVFNLLLAIPLLYGGMPSLAAIRRLQAGEGWMVGACVVPLLALAAAGVLGAGIRLAASVAVWFAVAQLFGSGMLAARQRNLPIRAGVSTGLISASPCFLIVALKSLG